MNNITIAGMVYQPVLRYTPIGKAVFNFKLSVYAGKDKEGTTQYLNCRVTAFGDLAESLNKTLAEKQRVTVKGQAQPIDEYTRDDGKRYLSIQVIANEVTAGDEFKPESLPADVPF